MKHLLVQCALGVLCLIFSSCKSATETQSGDAFMLGKVVLFDHNCDTLDDDSGVNISIPSLGKSTVSSSSGQWKIEGIPAGSHNVHFAKGGFITVAGQPIVADEVLPYPAVTDMAAFAKFIVKLEEVHFSNVTNAEVRDTILGYPDTVYSTKTYLSYTMELSELNPSGKQRYALLVVGRGDVDPGHASTFLYAHITWGPPSEKRFVIDQSPLDDIERLRQAGAKSGEMLNVGLFPYPDCGAQAGYDGTSAVYPGVLKEQGVFATVRMP